MWDKTWLLFWNKNLSLVCDCFFPLFAFWCLLKKETSERKYVVFSHWHILFLAVESLIIRNDGSNEGDALVLTTALSAQRQYLSNWLMTSSESLSNMHREISKNSLAITCRILNMFCSLNLQRRMGVEGIEPCCCSVVAGPRECRSFSTDPFCLRDKSGYPNPMSSCLEKWLTWEWGQYEFF